MNFQSIDDKTQLLTDLLNCGYMDLPRLFDVIKMGQELCDEDYVQDIVEASDTHCGKVDYNYLMCELMNMITYDLVNEIDDLDEVNDTYYYCDILETFWGGPYTNYADSWFQIECLDNWRSGNDKDKLLRDLMGELELIRKECSGEN